MTANVSESSATRSISAAIAIRSRPETRKRTFPFELNATTGAQTSVFSKDLDGADAGWAITKTPDGCLWPGGDSRSAAKADGSRFFVGAFANTRHGWPARAQRSLGTQPDPARHTAPDCCPAGLTVTNSGGKPSLTWTVSTDDRTELAYRIYRDGSLVGMTRYPSFVDTVPYSEPHTYVVVAYDSSGRTSTASNVVKINGGATSATPIAAPVVVTPPTVYDGRVQFAIEPTASNVASVKITKDGATLGYFRSDERTPLSNLALGRTATMSSRGDTYDTSRASPTGPAAAPSTSRPARRQTRGSRWTSARRNRSSRSTTWSPVSPEPWLRSTTSSPRRR